MNNKKWYALWLKQLAMAYGIMFFCRLLFLVVHFNFFKIHSTPAIVKSFFYGVFFDTSAIMYFLGAAWLVLGIPIASKWQTLLYYVQKNLFLLGVFLLVLLNLIDVGFFSISGKRSGFEIIYLQNSKNGSILSYVIDYWYLLLLLLLITFVVWVLLPYKLYQNQNLPKHKWIVLPITVVCLFLGARGSVGLKPLNSLDAAKYVPTNLVPLTINTPFQFLMTISHKTVNAYTFYPEQIADSLFCVYKTGENKNQRNVVLIIVESLGREYVGGYNNENGYTPFLDSLMQHSLVYTNAYANGKRSIEGIPAIVAGIPALIPTDYIGSTYQTNTLHGTGHYLAKQGYEVSFYHGGKNGTMGFDNFIAATGAGNYFGLNEYPNNQKDYDGNWGIPDEPYLQYFCDEISKKQQPFFTTVFTLSSHHPYKIPDKVKAMFKGGPLPIHAAVQYTDYALKCFFEKAQQQPWFKHTDFIITADHSSENVTQKYLTAAGKYAIPLVLYPRPTKEMNYTEEYTIDQIGILNLILKNRLDNVKYFSLSSNVAIQLENGMYQAIKHPWVLHFNGEQTIGFYNLETDSLMTNNLLASKLNQTELEEVKKIETQLKLTLQQFTTRLVNNKTY